MTVRVAINGFGRIGRNVLRAVIESGRTDIEVVAINDLGPVETNAHLIRYDSVHGKFPGTVTVDGDTIDVGRGPIKVTAVRNPAELPHKEMGVDIVLECTGIFTSKDKASAHLTAGAKRVLTKDRGKQGAPQADPDFMHGYRVDRGQFDNSYWMTDEDRVRSEVELKVDGETIDCFSLPNDPADARGALSWAAQPDPRKLDEAGSYGYLCRTEIPSRLVPGLIERGRVALTLKVPGDGGLALYGRGAGRYPIDLMVRAW